MQLIQWGKVLLAFCYNKNVREKGISFFTFWTPSYMLEAGKRVSGAIDLSCDGLFIGAKLYF